MVNPHMQCFLVYLVYFVVSSPHAVLFLCVLCVSQHVVLGRIFFWFFSTLAVLRVAPFSVGNIFRVLSNKGSIRS